ncbi:hypothetical protein OH77DRAFT_1429106 [Trametes cingulata]|nr:hypothetical protein OH77DRAFT_1429106 [Trametes cingulata]
MGPAVKPASTGPSFVPIEAGTSANTPGIIPRPTRMGSLDMLGGIPSGNSARIVCRGDPG